MAIKNVDPISRIEGHLGVKLTVDDGTGLVTGADVHGNMFRGFENFLIGREPNDAIIFTQRICGVCPVPHGMTSTFAAESVIGYNNGFQTFEDTIPKKAVYIRNLVLAAEFIMSHLTHFYHLAAPSYVQGPAMPPWTPYFNDNFYNPALLSVDSGGDNRLLPENGVQPLALGASAYSADVWSAVIKQYVKALRMRRLTFEAGALFAGRMPTTSCFIAGGVTTDKTDDLKDKCDMFQSIFEEIGVFIFKEHLPLVLTLGALYPAYEAVENAQLAFDSGLKFGLTDDVSTGVVDADKHSYGAGCGNFLSWGAFPVGTDTGAPTFVRKYQIGVEGSPKTISAADVEAYLKESISNSRYADPDGVFDGNDEAYPGDVPNTIPDRDAEYSWVKAPRWYKDADGVAATTNGQAMEVGPLARMVVNGWYPVSASSSTALSSADLAWPVGMAKPNTYAYLDGLNPALVAPDLAIALVRQGLATYCVTGVLDGVLYDGTNAVPVLGSQLFTVVGGDGSAASLTANVDDGGYYLNVADLSDATLEHAYVTLASVGYIGGTVAAWILNMVGGTSVMDRLRGRALEAAVLVQYMIGNFSTSGWSGGWNNTLKADAGVGGSEYKADTYTELEMPTTEISGFGATEAPRGALMHQITINGGKIQSYQCIVPTTWNASPKDTHDTLGPMEQAMVGVPYSTAPSTFALVSDFGTANENGTAGGGVEALRVAQTFDPCIACAIH